MNRPIGKYVLLIERAGARLTVMAPGLKELGFTVLHAFSLNAATSFLDATPLLSLVVIHEGVGLAEGKALVERVKQLQSEPPILWVGAEAGAPRASDELLVDVVIPPTAGPAELDAVGERVLRERMYPEPLATALKGACVDIMKEAYGTLLTPGTEVIRASGSTLAPVNALLPFCGARVTGSLLVCAESDHLARIRHRILPDDKNVSRAEIEDMAGEYANLVTGRTKTMFASYELPFDLGTPILLSGKDVKLRHRSSRPSLVLTFRDEDALLYVLFTYHLHDRSQKVAWRPPRPADIASGEICFL